MSLHQLLGVGHCAIRIRLSILSHSRRAGQTWKGNSGQIQIKTFWEHCEAWIPEGGPAPGQVSGPEVSPDAQEADVPGVPGVPSVTGVRVTVGVLRGQGQPEQPGGDQEQPGPGDQDLETGGEQAAAGPQHQAGGAHRQGEEREEIMWDAESVPRSECWSLITSRWREEEMLQKKIIR